MQIHDSKTITNSKIFNKLEQNNLCWDCMQNEKKCFSNIFVKNVLQSTYFPISQVHLAHISAPVAGSGIFLCLDSPGEHENPLCAKLANWRPSAGEKR